MKIDAFSLPQTFPHFMVTETIKPFMIDALGMEKDELIEKAHKLGFDPIWKPLPHIGENIFGFGLTVDGLVIPFMVRCVPDT